MQSCQYKWCRMKLSNPIQSSKKAEKKGNSPVKIKYLNPALDYLNNVSMWCCAPDAVKMIYGLVFPRTTADLRSDSALTDLGCVASSSGQRQHCAAEA